MKKSGWAIDWLWLCATAWSWRSPDQHESRSVPTPSLRASTPRRYISEDAAWIHKERTDIQAVTCTNNLASSKLLVHSGR
ncbi:hypothetical protein BDV36DRAFT_252750 [Aspergillus pseudocaelatus]|uniref:Secreted protein n=1 Tax=Aspergillus pseudocaelatus TaxID=1825620 RepID=A0ABQ6WPD1_9EURO|nr:hypothetical protein BDV36DRAFT_252750 [Aspergillus pseudocaelatus]